MSADERFLTPACPGYPALLRELEGHPKRLYYRGRPLAQISAHRVAVVGSRKASRYGLSWSRHLGQALARQGISVCSGLALGIDAAAHKGALEAASIYGKSAGVPIGVLGHGWQHIYPEANRILRHQMETRGVLLSEYTPETPPARWTFPQRNRIIAGMCQTVVIVEAGPRSGSLHTARFANDAGRDVWVVPNRPGTPNSAGVLSLLKDGAQPMFDIDEFVSQLVGELRVTYPLESGLELVPEELWPMLLALAQDDGSTPAELASAMELSVMEVSSKLSQLEILGLVERRFSGAWGILRFDLLQQYLQLCRERSWPHAA